MKAAVIVATYNRPEALALLLEGYLAQTDRNFEVVVADDGSREDTRETIRAYQARADFRIGHVWQENQGYRAATIRNKALRDSDADYIIYTDQDCVPLPTFIARHRALAEPGWFLAGNRVLLSESFTQRVVDERLPVWTWGLSGWLGPRRRGEINRLMPLLSFPDGPWRKVSARRWRGAKTCNLSAWRSDIERVNGMDESYTGWGLEDSDLVIRLIRAGVLRKSARCAAPVLHLWHREAPRNRLEENRRRLATLLAGTHVEARQGLDRHA